MSSPLLREVAREGWTCPDCGEFVNECWCGTIPQVPTGPEDKATSFPNKRRKHDGVERGVPGRADKPGR